MSNGGTIKALAGPVDKVFPGQPPKYTDPAELAQVFYNYFSQLDDEPPTITGLALHAGFASRQSFYDMAKRKKFSYIIDRARLLIEHYHERVVFMRQDPDYSLEWLRQNDDHDKGGEGEAGPNGPALRIEVVAVAAARPDDQG